MESYAESDDYENILKTKKVCRFCLAQNGAMGNIYVRDTRLKASAPLPLQIMAIASIEVFNNDGMPSYVCDECRLHFEYCYRFKHMCKRADTLLRQYPLVGKWPDPLSRPRIPTTEARDRPKIISQDIISLPTVKTETGSSPSKLTKSLISKAGASATQTITTKITLPQTSSTVLSLPTNTVNKMRQPLQQKQKLTNDQPIQPKPKLLNASPADTPEPPVPKRFKLERATDDVVDKSKLTASTIFFNKVENNEELSMNDVQMLIQAVDSEEEEQKIQVIPASTSKPKILNKATKRILNKEANVVYEPRLSKPQIKRDEAGNVELVAEILDPHQHEKPEADPLKSAPPVETNVFPCPYCVRSFPLQQLLDIHMINHTRERKHQCTECEKSFFSKYDLQKHVIIHTGERPFACSVCDKSFTRAALLQRHEKTHTDIAKYICVYCEKQFICKAELDKHTERHLKVRPFECTICKKTFAFKQGLERHETTHFTNKPLNCQYCEMSFFTAGKLARHLTAHAGKRAYPCKFCNKSYTLSHHLSRHLRSHIHKMSTFECTECTFQSNAMEDYFKHLSEHAAANGFCQLCKQPLDNKQVIDEHFKEHCKDAFACEFCDCIFLSAEMLQAHTNKEHTLELQEYEDSSQDIKIEPKLSTSKLTSKTQIEAIAEEEINLEDMGIYLDDILVDDVLLLNDEPKRQQQQKPKQQSVTVKETIKVEPATKQEQLKFEREQQRAKQGGAEQKQKQEQQVSPEISAKSRKVLTSDNQIKKIIVVTSPNKNTTTTATSPPVRRKVANSANNPPAVTVTKAKSSTTTTTTPPTFRQTKIKLEKEETSSVSPINPNKKSPEGGTQVSQVLKTLPKSVSVRRSVPNQATTTTTTTTKNDDDVPNESAAKDLPTPPQRRTTRVLKKSPMVEEPVKSKPKMQQKLPFTKEKVDDQTKKRRSK